MRDILQVSVKLNLHTIQMQTPDNKFHTKLYQKANKYVHQIYKTTKNYQKSELYGLTSQIRRAALSVMLNYIEGYARQNTKVYLNFLNISYGSLKETQYLLNFSMEEELMTKIDYKLIFSLGNEIGAMLWKTRQQINDK